MANNDLPALTEPLRDSAVPEVGSPRSIGGSTVASELTSRDVGGVAQDGLLEKPGVGRLDSVRRWLQEDPDAAVQLVQGLGDDDLAHLAAAIRDEGLARAIASGDQGALIEDAFESAFDRAGMPVNPWIEGLFVVCPGAIVSRNRANHVCRFVSVDDVWIWDSPDLVREDKRSLPGKSEGFRAVALLPIIEGMTLDLVSGRARSGAHQVDRVTSFVVRGAELVELSQRDVSGRGMR